MNTQPLFTTPDDYSPTLNVMGCKVTVLASGAATDSYEITRQFHTIVGEGPPPHYHDWDESFYVISGTFEFTCADKTHQCGPGTLVHVPAGTIHSFHYCGGGGEVLEITGKGSKATQMFTELSNSMSPGTPDPAEIPKMMGILKSNEVTVVE